MVIRRLAEISLHAVLLAHSHLVWASDVRYPGTSPLLAMPEWREIAYFGTDAGRRISEPSLGQDRTPQGAISQAPA